MNARHKQYADRLESSGDEFAKVLLTMSDEDLKRAPAPNEWSVHQAASHVRDTEVQVFLYRLRRTLNEENPAVPNFDQDAWIREHYSADEPIKKTVKEFLAARRQSVKLLRATKDKDWARGAIHSAYGKISVEWLVTHFYAHTLDHIGQILYARDVAILKHLNS